MDTRHNIVSGHYGGLLADAIAAKAKEPFDLYNATVRVVTPEGGIYGGITLKARLCSRREGSTWEGTINSVRYVPSGGLKLTVSLANSRIFKPKSSRLGPGWTPEKVRKAASLLYSWAMGKTSITTMADQLDAKLSPYQKHPDFERWVTQKEREHTPIYDDMTYADIEWWHTQVDAWIASL